MRVSSRRGRSGLTLMVLLVLVIIAATAAILVPLFGNIIGLTHGSVGAGNIESVARAFENHQAFHGTYPDQLDLLPTTPHSRHLGLPSTARNSQLPA